MDIPVDFLVASDAPGASLRMADAPKGGGTGLFVRRVCEHEKQRVHRRELPAGITLSVL